MTNRQAINPWISYLRPRPGARLRLFCLPYAGGGASVFRAWAQSLPPDVEVCPVQPPGREGRLRERPFEKMGPLVEALVGALSPLLDRPFAFYGHGAGALVAFEAARLLRRRGGPEPSALFVGGCRAPQLKDESRRTYDLPDAEFVDELRRLNGAPAEVLEHPELLGLMLPLLRADFALAQTYTYTEGPPLACPVTAFGGMTDDAASDEQLTEWRAQTAGRFTLWMLPGGHFFIHASQALLLQNLSRELGELAGGKV